MLKITDLTLANSTSFGIRGGDAKEEEKEDRKLEKAYRNVLFQQGAFVCDKMDNGHIEESEYFA